MRGSGRQRECRRRARGREDPTVRSFSIAFGAAVFGGRYKEADAFVNDPGGGVANRIGKNRDKQFYEPGLSLIRERDELFAQIRVTF